MNARRDVPANERRLTDADFESSARIFVWPCDKRKAHGPHYREPGGDQPPGDLAIYLSRKDPRACPGVKAHPKTMIGGRLL